MDPDEALKLLQGLARRLEDDVDEEAREMAERFIALDDWLSQGGFLPREWARNR